MESFRYYLNLLNEDRTDFNSWFQGSKIVDNNNEPLVMYHGTDKVFDRFETNALGLIFFSAHKNVAKEFASIYRNNGHVIECFLKVLNPFDHKIPAHLSHLVDHLDLSKISKYYFEKHDKDQQFGSKKPMPDQYVVNLLRQGLWTIYELPITIAGIKAAGYDGFYLDEFGDRTIAVFDDSQIWKNS